MMNLTSALSQTDRSPADRQEKAADDQVNELLFRTTELWRSESSWRCMNVRGMQKALCPICVSSIRQINEDDDFIQIVSFRY